MGPEETFMIAWVPNVGLPVPREPANAENKEPLSVLPFRFVFNMKHFPPCSITKGHSRPMA